MSIKIICDNCGEDKKPEEVFVVEQHICKECADKRIAEAEKVVTEKL